MTTCPSATAALRDARSLLFVPGNRPERFDKALTAGADAVILDLEDAVPAEAKATARQAIAQAWPAIRRQPVPVVVRINADGTPAFADDLAMLRALGEAGAGGIHGVMLPKAESADAVARVREALGEVPVLALIESAAGHEALPSLARAPGVLRLVVGHIDFMADTGIAVSEGEPELAPLRYAVAIATRLGKLAPAIDGVTVQTSDDARLHDDVARALRFGFGGKLCIHPRQVAAVHAALLPSDQELDWACRVVAADAAAGGAAVQLDGRMVDLPVVLQARRTLARAQGASPGATLA